MSFLETYLSVLTFIFLIITVCLIFLTIWAERDKAKYAAMLEDERELSIELRSRLANALNENANNKELQDSLRESFPHLNCVFDKHKPSTCAFNAGAGKTFSRVENGKVKKFFSEMFRD